MLSSGLGGSTTEVNHLFSPDYVKILLGETEIKKTPVFPDGYTTATIHYHWCGRSGSCENPVKVEDIELPTYSFAQLCVNTTLATTASGW